MSTIGFRPVTIDDLPTMHRWLNEPGVVRWWEGDDVSWDAVVDDYGPDDDDPYEHWLALVDGQPVGWIQCCALSEFEDDDAQGWLDHGIQPTAAGIDYLIGEPSARGTGLGSAMIAAFVSEVVFGMHPDWTQAAADPSKHNVASCRALEKAGFRSVGLIEEPAKDDSPWQLMVIDR